MPESFPIAPFRLLPRFFIPLEHRVYRLEKFFFSQIILNLFSQWKNKVRAQQVIRLKNLGKMAFAQLDNHKFAHIFYPSSPLSSS